MVKNILFYEGETHARNNSKSKQHFSQHKGNYSNNKEAYTDRSKSTGRKVGFAVDLQTSPEEGHYQEKHPSTQLK